MSWRSSWWGAACRTTRSARREAWRGGVVLRGDGSVDTARSSITVQVNTLRSDDSRRDAYLRRSALQTNAYPEATFVVREAPGMPWPLPAAGEAAFTLVGDLTVHGVTRPAEWGVNAVFGPDGVAGRAKTEFTFGDFGMGVPRVAIVLSVENRIRLEMDFTATLAC